jgi:hypothetical protein
MRSAALRIHERHHELLKNSPLGLSEEARRRIERTFVEDQIDPHTREIAAAVVRLAEAVKQRVGTEWHAHPRSYEVFATALSSRLAKYRPVKAPETAGLLIDSADDAPTIGRMLERDDLRSQLIQSEKKTGEAGRTTDPLAPEGPTVEMLRQLVQALNESVPDGTAENSTVKRSQRE